MLKYFFQFIVVSSICFAPLSSGYAQNKNIDKDDILFLDLATGRVTIQMLPDIAPITVARIKSLANQGFYDGIVFHRVIDNFMAQGGDPTGTGRGGSGQSIPDEFSQAPFQRGTVAMANSGAPNSQDSQFFICFQPAPWLTGKYTIWGKVIDGMEHIDTIKKGSSQRNGMVSNPDKIVRMRTATANES